MGIVAFGNLKGGVGKSSTAVHFAYWLRFVKKKNVIAVDADAERSTSKWLKAIAPDFPVETITDPDALAERIPQLGKDYPWIVIDNAANSSEATRMTVMNSTVVVIPITPTGLDMATATSAVRLVRQMQRNGTPKVGLFLNRAIKNTKLLSDAKDLLSAIEDITVLRSIVYQRQPIADAYLQNAVVWTLPRTQDARGDYEKLFAEVLRLTK
jgi:chromosome partitioning protein